MFKYLYAIHPPLGMAIVNIALINVSAIFILTSFIFVLDTIGRTKDYLKLVRKGESYFTHEVIKLYGKSWCGRTLVKSVHPYAREYYHHLGYRWWNVFPDGMFSKRTPLLRKRFWVNLISGH